MARRSDHSRDELKELILNTSWSIVGSEGFDGLSARRIAKEIGYAPGTIYNLYQSMDDLILHVNARTLDILYTVLSAEECNDDKQCSAENMKTMARLYMEFAQTHRPYWLMLFRHQLPEARKSMGWYQDKIDLLFKPLEGVLTPFYSESDNRKKRVSARVLWASIHGLCFLQETGKIPVVSKGEEVPDMAGFLIDTFVRGIEE
jgi:AcrR family transcriptional regulator